MADPKIEDKKPASRVEASPLHTEKSAQHLPPHERPSATQKGGWIDSVLGDAMPAHFSATNDKDAGLIARVVDIKDKRARGVTMLSGQDLNDVREFAALVGLKTPHAAH